MECIYNLGTIVSATPITSLEKRRWGKTLTLFAFFDEKNILEHLFAEFCANQEQKLESAKLLIWLYTFSNAAGQWESNLFVEVLKDSSLLQAFTGELDRFYHSSLHPLNKD